MEKRNSREKAQKAQNRRAGIAAKERRELKETPNVGGARLPKELSA
jgi:hypothetical protein